jgi:putative membrane protein
VTLSVLAFLLVVLVGLLHAGFLVLEMFLWDHRVGRAVFRLDPDFAKRSATLAANQGLYNGFLAAGLFWGAFAGRTDVSIFFLTCVILAGAYGGFTVKRTIFVTQGIPAILALAAVLAPR